MATVTSAARGIEATTGFSLSRPKVIAVGMAFTAVVSAINLLGRPIAAIDTDAYAEVAAVRNDYWTFALIGGISMGVVYLLAGIATCMLVTRRGATLATLAAVLLTIGGIAFATGFFALGSVSWFTTGGEAGDSAGFEFFQEHSIRAFGPQMVGFLLATVGIILAGVALWRSRTVPRWLAIAIPATSVLAIISGTGLVYDLINAVFMATIVALAWMLFRSDRTQ